MPDWLRPYEQWLVWLGFSSVVFVLFSVTLIPALIARLPADYFAHERRDRSWVPRRWVPLRVAFIAAKNLLGLVVVVCGILMLVLPGQGLLTLVIGLSLLDFPGKYRLERWLLGHRPVLRGLNWLRERMNKPPFHEPFRARRRPRRTHAPERG